MNDLTRHTFKAENPVTHTEVLVTIYRNGDTIVHVEIATRAPGVPTWSPPLLNFTEVQ